jgi:hypothetical protein
MTIKSKGIKIDKNGRLQRDKRCKEIYWINQPDSSKREDSQECEMRCSEHCGNTVRKVQ